MFASKTAAWGLPHSCHPWDGAGGDEGLAVAPECRCSRGARGSVPAIVGLSSLLHPLSRMRAHHPPTPPLTPSASPMGTTPPQSHSAWGNPETSPLQRGTGPHRCLPHRREHRASVSLTHPAAAPPPGVAGRARLPGGVVVGGGGVCMCVCGPVSSNTPPPPWVLPPPRHLRRRELQTAALRCGFGLALTPPPPLGGQQGFRLGCPPWAELGAPRNRCTLGCLTTLQGSGCHHTTHT